MPGSLPADTFPLRCRVRRICCEAEDPLLPGLKLLQKWRIVEGARQHPGCARFVDDLGAVGFRRREHVQRCRCALRCSVDPPQDATGAAPVMARGCFHDDGVHHLRRTQVLTSESSSRIDFDFGQEHRIASSTSAMGSCASAVSAPDACTGTMSRSTSRKL